MAKKAKSGTTGQYTVDQLNDPILILETTYSASTEVILLW